MPLDPMNDITRNFSTIVPGEPRVSTVFLALNEVLARLDSEARPRREELRLGEGGVLHVDR